MQKQKLTAREQTARTILEICDFLLVQGILARRINVLPIPLPTGGYRPSTMRGMPDVMGIMPATGRSICIEVKTGRDKLRPEQVAFLNAARQLGAKVIVATDINDFKRKFYGI